MCIPAVGVSSTLNSGDRMTHLVVFFLAMLYIAAEYAKLHRRSLILLLTCYML